MDHIKGRRSPKPQQNASWAKDRVELARPPADARWDPSALPADDTNDEEPRWTELQLASRDGNVELVTKILSRCGDASERVATVNAPAIGYYGQTALQAACLREHETVVQILLTAGADISAAGGNNIYRNAFELACGTGNLRLVRMLLDAGAVVSPKSVARYQGRTPIQAAAESGQTEVVGLLLDLGADINAPASPSSGTTALQAACFQEHCDLVRLLLARGADVNGQAGRFNGYTALQGACLAGNREIVEILLENGADVDAPGSVLGGGTALHAAVGRSHIEIVEQLLSAGANPNSTAGRRRQTPLQSAYLTGSQDIVRVLIDRGATGPLTGGKILFGNGRTKTWQWADFTSGLEERSE